MKALALAAPIVLALLAFYPPVGGAQKGNHYPPGCLRQADINIGYYPYVVVRETVIRVAPDEGAPRIRLLGPGRRFGVQSVPNPDRLSDPGVPAPVNGYVWGYSKKGGRSAWVRADALAPDPVGGWADGPSHVDFEAGGVGVPRLRAHPRFTLGRAASGWTTVVDQSAYLRWAPNGAARLIVWHGEPLRLLWRSSGHVCVDAGGARGWVNVDYTTAGY